MEDFLIFFGIAIVLPATIFILGFFLIEKYILPLNNLKYETFATISYSIVCTTAIIGCMYFASNRELARIKAAFERPKPVSCEQEIP